MPYLDYKTKVWVRLYFKPDTKVDDILSSLGDVFSPSDLMTSNIGFTESEVLFDSEELVDVENDEPTIEIYEDSETSAMGNEVWNNVDLLIQKT